MLDLSIKLMGIRMNGDAVFARMGASTEAAVITYIVDPNLLRLVMDVAGTHKVAAIRYMRATMNIGLKEAKDLVDLISARFFFDEVTGMIAAKTL